MEDSSYDLGFVGLKHNLVSFLQTNLWTSNKLTKFNIEPFDKTNSNYSYILEYNSKYNIEIVGKNDNPDLIKQIYSYKPNLSNKFVCIGNNSGDEIFGKFDDLVFVIKNKLIYID